MILSFFVKIRSCSFDISHYLFICDLKRTKINERKEDYHKKNVGYSRNGIENILDHRNHCFRAENYAGAYIYTYIHIILYIIF